MKILVTGHRGFIGGHLCEGIQKSGHELHGYDLWGGDDIRDRRKLETLFEMEHFDIVVHLAALAGVRRGELYPEEYISTNVIGTKNVVDMCEKHGVKRLISFSSSSIYGDVGVNSGVTEHFVAQPVSIYGMSKAMAEQIVNRAKLETVIIRPFTVYGPYGRKDQVMVRWIEAVKRGERVKVYADDQKQAKQIQRGYTHVHDLVRGVMMAITGPSKFQHSIYNLGGDKTVSLWDLIEAFRSAKKDFAWEYVGRQQGDAMRSFADTHRAERDFGWTPKKEFAKEIKKLIKEGLRS